MQCLFGLCLSLLSLVGAVRNTDSEFEVRVKSDTTSLPSDMLSYSLHAYWAKIDVQELWEDLQSNKALQTLATQAALDFEKLVEDFAAEGTVDSKEVLHSQYLQLEKLRASFRSIRESCAKPSGLVHWFIADQEWENVSSSISTAVTEIEETLELLVDELFCGRFEALTEEHLGEVQKMIDDWENMSGVTWFPQRSVANMAIRVDKGEDGTGLTEDDVKFAQARAWVEDWNLYDTNFPDKLLDDAMTSNETKTAFQTALREVALLLAEMVQCSPACGVRARALRDRVTLCSKADHLCHVPSSSSGILGGLLGRKAIDHMFDAWALLTPTKPASVIHLAQRLLTAKSAKRIEMCKASLRVLSEPISMEA